MDLPLSLSAVKTALPLTGVVFVFAIRWMVARLSHWRPPSSQPCQSRARQRQVRLSAASRKVVRQRAPGERGKHRECARCLKRSDNCIAHGCLPYVHKIDTRSFRKFKHSLAKLDARENSRRYSSDCVDVAVASKFARVLHAQGFTKMAVYSCCLMGQYGNNLRTWSKLLEARSKDKIDWKAMHAKIEECKRLFANSKNGRGLHSRNCMPGHPFERRDGDATYVTSEVRGLRALWRSSHLTSIASRVQSGITCFAEYEEALGSFRKLQGDIVGCLGEYHLKVALDHLVAADLCPRRHVSVWPVSPSGGTAKGLRLIFGSKTANPETLRVTLMELFARLRRDRALSANDWPGSIGAALCWQKRDSVASIAGDTRYEYTTSTSEMELGTLRRLNIVVPGLYDA